MWLVMALPMARDSTVMMRCPMLPLNLQVCFGEGQLSEFFTSMGDFFTHIFNAVKDRQLFSKCGVTAGGRGGWGQGGGLLQGTARMGAIL